MILRVKLKSMFKKIIGKCKNLLILGRYDNPTGALLLMWPCFWGVLSFKSQLDHIFASLSLFVIGSFVMRGAGCCVNDLFDKNFDKYVQRTKDRPLASGKVKNYEAILFICFQLFIGLMVVKQFNWQVILFSFSIIPLVIFYPFLKRITYFPQFFLGLAFNWGVIVGHMTQNQEFDFQILYLYFAGVFLTTAYDTIYGFQDINDDKKLGLKSLSILIEKNKNSLLLLYFLSFALFFVFFFLKFQNQILVYIFSFTILIIYLHQFYSLKIGVSKIKIFKSNALYGFLISLMILILNYL